MDGIFFFNYSQRICFIMTSTNHGRQSVQASIFCKCSRTSPRPPWFLFPPPPGVSEFPLCVCQAPHYKNTSLCSCHSLKFFFFLQRSSIRSTLPSESHSVYLLTCLQSSIAALQASNQLLELLDRLVLEIQVSAFSI